MALARCTLKPALALGAGVRQQRCECADECVDLLTNNFSDVSN